MGISIGTPSFEDIRAEIEGYGFDETASVSRAGTWTSGQAIVSGINTLSLRPFMFVSGAGIAPGTRILSITTSDPLNGVLVLDTPTTAGGSGANLTFTYYCVKSDDWLANTRDNFVIPWVEKHTRQSYHGIQQAKEYYDGTGSSLMILRRRPIVSLLNIHYTNVDSNLYYLTPSAIQVLTDEGILKAKANFNESTYIPIFYRGDRNIVIEYTYGYSTMPADVSKAIAMLVAEQALASAASKTGGGDLSGDGYGRSFGKSGKYTHERRRLATAALAILRPMMTGAGS